MATFASFVFILTALFITFDIIARRYFGFSSKGTDEMSGYALAVGTSFGFAYVLSVKGHIRVDIILVKFPRWIQGWLNLVALLFLMFFLVIAIWRIWTVVFFSFEYGSRANTVLLTPIGWPQGVWAIGVTIFGLLAFIMTVEALADLLRGRANEVAFKAGPASVEEEIEKVLKETEARLS